MLAIRPLFACFCFCPLLHPDIPQCVRRIAGGGGGVRVGSGVHGSYTFPVQADGFFLLPLPWHRVIDTR